MENGYISAEGEIIAGCIDGRGGSKNHYPNSAGASLSLFVAARLLGFEIEADEFFRELATKGLALGAHIDEHSATAPDKTGCGANDRLDEILGKLINNESRQKILEQIRTLDVEIDDHVLEEAAAIAASLDLDTSRERLAAIEDAGGVVEKLTGDHEETAVIVNLVSNTTLDRTKSDGKYFNVDVWAFGPSARAVLTTLNKNIDESVIAKFVLILIAFNLATAQVLAPTAPIKLRERDEK